MTEQLEARRGKRVFNAASALCGSTGLIVSVYYLWQGRGVEALILGFVAAAAAFLAFLLVYCNLASDS